MLKIWLVKFSNGEEWHIFGEPFDVLLYSAGHAFINRHEGNPTITYLRWVKA